MEHAMIYASGVDCISIFSSECDSSPLETVVKLRALKPFRNGTCAHFVDAAELELRLLGGNSVENKVSLRVVQQTEQVARLVNLHNVCAHTHQKKNRQWESL